jgi:hypothetical protein
LRSLAGSVEQQCENVVSFFLMFYCSDFRQDLVRPLG